jgi:thiol:disulfide interchange protein
MIRALVVVALAATACGGDGDPPTAEVHTTYTWASDEAQAFTRAREENKGVLLHFFASWSVPSAELQLMLREPRIAAVIGPRFVPLQVDVSDGSDAVLAVQERYAALTIPAIVMLDANGRVVGRVTQLQNVDELRVTLEQGARKLR